MAIIGFESFDIYGNSVPALLLRGYVSIGTVGAQISVINANTRTGAGALEFGAVGNSDRGIGRVLDAPVNVLFVGAALNVTTTISADRRPNYGICAGTSTDWAEYKINFNANLGISVYNNSTEIGRSISNLIVTGTYYYVEARFTRNSGGVNTGSIEVRVNNIVVVTVNNINIPNQFVRFMLGGLSTNIGSGSAYTLRADDLVWYDNTGTDNNNYLGDRRVFTIMPDADLTPMQWDTSSGTSRFQLINELNPNDAGFIIANTAGNQSQFGVANVPLDVNNVAAIQVVARAFKASAGPATFRLGVNSNSNIINSGEFSPNTTVAYYSAIFDRNPDGNIPWFRNAIDNAALVTTRVI